jgi:hypothetical protein
MPALILPTTPGGVPAGAQTPNQLTASKGGHAALRDRRHARVLLEPRFARHRNRTDVARPNAGVHPLRAQEGQRHVPAQEPAVAGAPPGQPIPGKPFRGRTQPHAQPGVNLKEIVTA